MTTCFSQVTHFIFLIQSLCCVQLFATPWTAARQASLSFTTSRSVLKLVSTESVMPSNHLVFCRPLLLLFTVPEAGKSKIKVPAWSHSGEGLLSGSEHLLMSSHGRGDKRSLWSLFYEGTHPFMRTSPSSQNPHLLNYHPLRFRIST